MHRNTHTYTHTHIHTHSCTNAWLYLPFGDVCITSIVMCVCVCQVPALADAGFRVLALDMKGYGASSAPPGQAD